MICCSKISGTKTRTDNFHYFVGIEVILREILMNMRMFMYLKEEFSRMDNGWNVFKSSGRIEDYLKYRREQSAISAENSMKFERVECNEPDSRCDRHGVERDAYQ